MNLSTKSRYGLRMLIDISLQRENSPITLASIASRQNVSPNYLEQVASDLKRAGFIHSVKGAGGGYLLSGSPDDIIIGDVLKVLEGDVRVTDRDHGDESILKEIIRESIYDVINKNIARYVNSITLGELINGNMHFV